MKKKTWLEKAEAFPCPTCQLGKMNWGVKGKVISTETLDSLRDNEFHRNGIIFPYTTELVSSHLKCDKCGDVVVGTYKRIDDVRNVDAEGYEQSIYEPLHFYPAPLIIDIPESCPNDVKNPVELSFLLFWVDLNSCANKIRIALEELMNHCGISGADSNGKFVSLDSRLNEYGKKKNAKVGELLTAIKWIGNASSHSTGINKKTVVAAYELLEYALELAFPDREQRLTNMSKIITGNKGHL